MSKQESGSSSVYRFDDLHLAAYDRCVDLGFCLSPSQYYNGMARQAKKKMNKNKRMRKLKKLLRLQQKKEQEQVILKLEV